MEATLPWRFGRKERDWMKDCNCRIRYLPDRSPLGKLWAWPWVRQFFGKWCLKSYLVKFWRAQFYLLPRVMPPAFRWRGPYCSLRTGSGHKREQKFQLRNNIDFFKTNWRLITFQTNFITSNFRRTIVVWLEGNEKVKKWGSAFYRENGLIVTSLYVAHRPEGKERLRFCLHSF